MSVRDKDYSTSNATVCLRWNRKDNLKWPMRTGHSEKSDQQGSHSLLLDTFFIFCIVPQKTNDIRIQNIITNDESTMMSLTTASLSRNSLVLRTMQRTVIRLLTSKVAASAAEALADLSLNGATIALGGFGTSGVPETLVKELSRNSREAIDSLHPRLVGDSRSCSAGLS